MTAELIFDFGVPRAEVPRCSQVRSTLLSASVQALKANGHFDAYLERLPARYQNPVLQTPAGVWLPIDVGVAHYRACDELGLNLDEVTHMGDRVADSTHRTLLATVFSLARSAGGTPLHLLEQTPRLWSRFYVGSGLALYKLGPKDAELHIVGNALAAIDYWRTALTGLFGGLARTLARSCFVRLVSTGTSADHFVSYRFSWV